VGSETRITIIDLARMIVSLSGKDIEIVLTPAETLVWGQAVDCSEALRLLDEWRPEMPLSEGLRRVFEYARGLLEPEEGGILSTPGGGRPPPGP